MRLKQRIEQLEATVGDGDNLTIDTRGMTASQANQAITKAERQVGKNGCVMVVWNTHDRPLPKNAQVIMRIQPGCLDKLKG